MRSIFKGEEARCGLSVPGLLHKLVQISLSEILGIKSNSFTKFLVRYTKYHVLQRTSQGYCNKKDSLGSLRCNPQLMMYLVYTDIHYINLDTKLIVISVIAPFFIRRENKHFVHCNISKMPMFGGS